MRLLCRIFLAACLFPVMAYTTGGQAAPPTAPAPTSLRVVLFHSPICSACRSVNKNLPGILKDFGGKISLELYSVATDQGLNDFYTYSDFYRSGNEEVPIIFVGQRYLVGERKILSELAGVIGQELQKGSVTFNPRATASQPASGPAVAAEAGDTGKAEELVQPVYVQRFAQFQAGAVVAAGLLDGINPCAFTTIVFLLSVLAMVGKTRRQLAMVGLSFTATVFVTYTLLGVGMLWAVKAFSVSRGLSTGFAYTVGGLALALSAWTVVDVVRFRRSGKTQDMTLSLPLSIKRRVHKIIHTGLGWRSMLIGTLACGFLVTLLESVCTGQVYLPTLVLVWRVPGLRAHALGYLLLYNLMFIAPLAVVMALAYLGVGSEKLGSLFRRHLTAVKLAMAGLFAALGGMVLLTA